MVVRIASQLVRSDVSAILQGSSVPEYGRNRFFVDAGGIAVKMRETGGIAAQLRSCFQPKNFGFASKVFDPKYRKHDPVQYLVIEPAFFALFPIMKRFFPFTVPFVLPTNQ
ncbi:hypothetical protein QL285_065452 [Trifolium repens]|nr:hypothetical protein QL285_065452 [Trifolium repens]